MTNYSSHAILSLKIKIPIKTRRVVVSDKSLFYKSFEAGTEIDDFFEKLQEYAEESPSGNPVYILNNPLGDKKYSYS